MLKNAVNSSRFRISVLELLKLLNLENLSFKLGPTDIFPWPLDSNSKDISYKEPAFFKFLIPVLTIL